MGFSEVSPTMNANEMKLDELGQNELMNDANYSKEAEAEFMELFRKCKNGQDEESEKREEELIDLKDQLEEERKDWQRKRNQKNQKIRTLQDEIMEMEDSIETRKFKISELEKQKSVMAKCVKNETAYYDISKILDERTRKKYKRI